MKSKWISRKLFVAIISVVAIVVGIHRGNPDLETEVMDVGVNIVDVLIAIISSVYIFAQGRVDRAIAEHGE